MSRSPKTKQPSSSSVQGADPGRRPRQLSRPSDAGRSRPAVKLVRSKEPDPVPGGPTATKGAAIIALLGSDEGTTIPAICLATGWQPHSVRGFLSATVKKRLGMPLVSERQSDGERRYRIANHEAAGS